MAKRNQYWLQMCNQYWFFFTVQELNSIEIVKKKTILSHFSKLAWNLLINKSSQ